MLFISKINEMSDLDNSQLAQILSEYENCKHTKLYQIVRQIIEGNFCKDSYYSSTYGNMTLKFSYTNDDCDIVYYDNIQQYTKRMRLNQKKVSK